MMIKKITPFIAGLLFLFTTTAHADHSVTIKGAWIADAPPVAKIRAAYLTLKNEGKHDVTIKSFTSNDFDRIELHKTVEKDGLIQMEEIHDLTIKPGQQIMFKPGGYHLMLFNPKNRLHKGDKVKFQVTLTDGQKTIFVAVVRDRGNGSSKMEHKCGGGKCGGKCGGK